MKDDDALMVYLTSKALENASLHVNPTAPGIQGAALESLVSQFRHVMGLIERMSLVYPQELLEAMIYSPRFSEKNHKNSDDLAAWCAELQKNLENVMAGTHRYQVHVDEDKERHILLPKVEITAHGIPNYHLFGHEFFASNEYNAIAGLGETLQGLIEEGAYVQRGERTQAVESFQQALEWLMSESRRGLNTQRYKGLGEMNPEQLWETTMDPDSRRMLQVTIEDAIEADQMFTTLMGDQVEPRRDFIETNALSVVNLDV